MSLFLMAPKTKDNVSILKLVRVTYLLRLKRSITGLHPPDPYWIKKSLLQSSSQESLPLTRFLYPESCPFLLEVPELLQTLQSRGRTLKVPTTQAGGDGMGLNSKSERSPPSTSALKAFQRRPKVFQLRLRGR